MAPKIRTEVVSSTETADAMSKIGALAVFKGDRCEIEIPNDKLFELSLEESGALDRLPAPVCEAVFRQLDSLRERQESEEPKFEEKDVSCSNGQFEVNVTVNSRKYRHVFKSRGGSAYEFQASFFPVLSQEQESLLASLPMGKDRFTFTADIDENKSGTRVDSPLSQWENFKLGNQMTSRRQGYAEALVYYQNSRTKGAPPSASEARLDLASTGRNTARYVYSVGEQLFAANKYFPKALKIAEQCLAIRTSKGSDSGNPPEPSAVAGTLIESPTGPPQ